MPTTIRGTAPVLLAIAGAMPLAAQTPEARFAELERAYTEAVADHRGRLQKVYASDEYLKAREERDSKALAALRASVEGVDHAAHAAAFAAAAEEFAGKGSVRFLVWLVQNGRNSGDHAKAALETLMTQHAGSKDLLPLVENNPYLLTNYAGVSADVANAALETLAASRHPMVRAHALYAQWTQAQRDKTATAERKAAAEAGLEDALELAKGTLLEAKINAPAFAQDRLQVGMVAPDIEGEDVDGQQFRLSDYRGKVVVLDFWGDW